MKINMHKFRKQDFEIKVLANKAEFLGYPGEQLFWERPEVKKYPRELVEKAIRSRPRWFAHQNLCDVLEGVDRG